MTTSAKGSRSSPWNWNKRIGGRMVQIAPPKIEEIRRHCAEIAGDVQALSHKLHSSKLEYLGLAAAIRSFCREFSQQHDAERPVHR